MLKRLDHVAVAVKDASAVLPFYLQGLGLEIAHEETVPWAGVKTIFLPLGETNLELLEPVTEDSAIAKFIAGKGEGLHHLCFEVQDIEAALRSLAAQGYELIDREPRPGAHGKRVAFLHPRAAHGVLIELSQAVDER